eukprot:14539941-Ditylum_brightwellii.AAC.1
MKEVQFYQILNEEIYKEFGIDPLENILKPGFFNPDQQADRKLPYVTHMYMRCILWNSYQKGENGKLVDWLPQIAEDPKEWKIFQRSLTPNLTGRQNRDREA